MPTPTRSSPTQESLTMFKEMVSAIQTETVRRMFSVRLGRTRRSRSGCQGHGGVGRRRHRPKKQPSSNKTAAPTLPCGSGLKWKKHLGVPRH
ncbi:MAG: hypothetical protein ACLTYN_16945 [Dysosmobacter welbionis]